MTASALVTIITPSFNQGRYLADCLNSVRCQSYRNIEHIVQDNESTDSTHSVLSSCAWASLKANIEQDDGQSDALNRAIQRARGDYIGWINSDDAYFDQRAVQIAVEYLDRHPTATAVYSPGILINEQNQILQVTGNLDWRPGVFSKLNYIVQPTLFFRRSAVASPIFDPTLHYAMDRDLIYRLARSGPIGFIDTPLAIDRHQRQRKVLAVTELMKEVERVNERYQLCDVASTLNVVSARIEYRIRGSQSLFKLRATCRPAIPVIWPSRLELFKACVRRRRTFEFAKEPSCN